MNISEFDYELPQELIAQTPLKDRSSSRLMVVDKNNGIIDNLAHRLLVFVEAYY